MLTCRELTELVTDYLEDRLSFGQRLRFEMHLGLCGDCRAYLRQMKQTIATLGSLHGGDIPEKASKELLTRFRAWKKDAGT
jgi:predicted anti-sigma-YlaC factor YlaD